MTLLWLARYVESPAKTYLNCIFAFGVTSKVIAPPGRSRRWRPPSTVA